MIFWVGVGCSSKEQYVRGCWIILCLTPHWWTNHSQIFSTILSTPPPNNHPHFDPTCAKNKVQTMEEFYSGMRQSSKSWANLFFSFSASKFIPASNTSFTKNCFPIFLYICLFDAIGTTSTMNAWNNVTCCQAPVGIPPPIFFSR